MLPKPPAVMSCLCSALTVPQCLQAQEISLNFHCKCEQYVQFATGSFFNFNGTAGIWRRKTIITVGGWKSRTTVEDMDLSLRTFVNGWKAVYLTDTTCVNEVSHHKLLLRGSCAGQQLTGMSSNRSGCSCCLHTKIVLSFTMLATVSRWQDSSDTLVGL